MTKRLHDWLTANADRRPESCAIVFREQSVTYGELNRASNRLARALQAAGCIRGDRVALLAHKSPAALCAIFGVLKADCIYVPVDPSAPVGEIARVLQLCECRCLIAENATSGIVNKLIETEQLPFCTRVGWLDHGPELPRGTKAQFARQDILSLPDRPLSSGVNSGDPAQIMFTAGSTGAPKPVVTTHSNFIHFINWAVEWLGFTPSDRISCFSPLHNDLSTFDIFSAVAAGAQVHLAPPEISVLPHRLANFIRKSELTQWFSLPAVLHRMARLDIVQKNHFPKLRRLLWSREGFPTSSLIYWMRRLPHVSFVNLYGATEATIASSYHRILRCPEDAKSEIPIGTPCDGEVLSVLDDHLQPIPQGETGELYISGAGVAAGYWRDPDETGEFFRSNPFRTDPLHPNSAERMFRTGDLAKIGNDGKTYLLGGADSLLVTRECRIELAEIETAMESIPRIQEAVVLVVDLPDVAGSGAAGKEICCAYVPLPGAAAPPASVEMELRRALRDAIIPARWMVLDDLPRTSSGKVDRLLLKQRFVEEEAESLRALPNVAQEPPRIHSAAGD